MALSLKHQTAAQFLARFRELYRNASGDEAARLAEWLYDRQQSGDVTAAQVRAAFGLTAAQMTAMTARLKSLRDARATLRGARGE